MSVVYTENFEPVPFDKKEILRYCGGAENSEQLEELLDNCLSEIDGKISNRVCYCELKISETENGLDLGFCKTNSKLILRHLNGCDKLILFAATVGIETDRLISKYSRISPVKALMFQAIGAERIEALCDTFENKIKAQYAAEGRECVYRISAGYGDIPLEMQKDIFKILDCPKRIGLSLNESLLMSPTKSVTAVIGVKKP